MSAVIVSPEVQVTVDISREGTVVLGINTRKEGRAPARHGVILSKERATAVAAVLISAATGGRDIVGTITAVEHLVQRLGGVR